VKAVARTFVAFVCLALPTAGLADSVVFSQVGPGGGLPSRFVAPSEAADGAPLYGNVYQFQITTDADILSIDEVTVVADSLYNHPTFDPTAIDPSLLLAVIALYPSVGADSWINTPGLTTRFGPDLPGSIHTSFGDLSNDGPQNQFMFAQLTVSTGTAFTFSGRVTIGSTNPLQTFVAPFNFTYFGFTSPEPSSAVMVGVAGVSLLAARRRR